MQQNIPMVDLISQYKKIKDEIDTGIQEVLDCAGFINGAPVKDFQADLEQYLGVEHAIPCANGTDALQIALMSLGLKAGDEVITPSFTYIATVEVVALLGLKPVFCDVDPETFTATADMIEACITPKTKAIIPVHLYGQSAHMEPILAMAQKHNIPIIEDNAQAIGGNYTFCDGSKKSNGSMGSIGTTSFFPSKNLGCYGDGGAIFTNDSDLASAMRMIANHGQSERYIHERVGCNSRLDSIQAAVLKVKLKKLDDYCDARRKVADYYDAAFANHPKIKTPLRANYSHHVFHQYTLVLEGVDRGKLIEGLKDNGIPSMMYYPIPCHKQKMFEAYGVENSNLPNTDWLTSRVLSLPIHTEMEESTLEYITNHFLKLV